MANENKKKDEDKKPFTEEDFIEALKKASQPVSQPSESQESDEETDQTLE
jgi:FixJ family two-component response regulator